MSEATVTADSGSSSPLTGAPRAGSRWRRMSAIFRAELRTQILRPMFWIMVGLLVLVTWGLSSGSLTISTGDSSVGGQKAWLNSQYNLSLTFVLIGFLLYCFFAAIAAGMSIIRDDETGASEVLHSTPLTPGEYVLAKFAGVMTALGLATAVHLVATIVFYQWLPVPNPEELRGPFRLTNYLIPALLFTAPIVLFFAAVAFFFGERTRKPILVFVVPIAVFLACAFFLWGWSPTWLDPAINRLLMIIEPSGYRWLNETLLKVDRGVEYYNTQPIALDATFWLNRLWVIGVSILGVLASIRHCRKAIGGDLAPGPIARWWQARQKRKEAARGQTETEAGTVSAVSVPPPLEELGMGSSRPGLLRGIAAVARAEFRELCNQPGLYIFVPLILLQILGSSLVALGAFQTPLLLTAGSIAVRSLNTITFLVCFLLLFYTVESIARDRANGIDALIYSTPLATASILFGKAIANALVGVVVVVAAFLGASVAMLVQGQAPLEIWPFALVWGVLLLPTFLVWNAFVTAVQALTRNRYTTYAAGIGLVALTFYHQFQGNMTWLWNWNLWGVLRWSDMSIFEIDRRALVLNRITALGVAVFLTMLSVRFFARRDLDASRLVHRMSPRSLLRGSFRLAPWALLPVITGSILAHDVRNGPGSEAAEKRQKDYWRRNLATYRDYQPPALQHLDLDLELFPERSAYEVKGSYRFLNARDEPVRELALTASASLEDLQWTLDGEAAEFENRSDLFVRELEPPLLPGETIEVGFAHHGSYPYGVTKNGGGAGTFILPSGVVLHIFGPMFLPIPGYLESIGIDEENRYEPKQYADDFWRETLDPAIGSATPFTSRARITAPADLTVNSVGELVSESEQDGRRTVVWESDYPVKLMNVVAGKWAVERRDGIALFYHPGHTYNIEEITDAMVAARRYFSEWFYPYPWKELKISEFPGLASYAQGFPTNITFSEQIGFLTRSDEKARVAFMVTAHEIAHQWWGQPGDARCWPRRQHPLRRHVALRHPATPRGCPGRAGADRVRQAHRRELRRAAPGRF